MSDAIESPFTTSEVDDPVDANITYPMIEHLLSDEQVNDLAGGRREV